MAMYRVARRLHVGGDKFLEVGQMASLDWLNQQQRDHLEDCGAISEVHAPPLSALPKWGKRAERLKPLGIITATDLLESDSAKVAEAVGVQPATIDRWKDLVKDKWLVVPSTESKSG